MSVNPYSAPVGQADVTGFEGSVASNQWQTIVQPLVEVAGWNKFAGIMFIMVGALYCMTIVGAVVGWVPIWIGILLLKSADNLRLNSPDAAHQAASQLAKIIKIVGVSMAVFLGLMLLYFGFILTALLFVGLSSNPGSAPPF